MIRTIKASENGINWQSRNLIAILFFSYILSAITAFLLLENNTTQAKFETDSTSPEFIRTFPGQEIVYNSIPPTETVHSETITKTNEAIFAEKASKPIEPTLVANPAKGVNENKKLEEPSSASEVVTVSIKKTPSQKVVKALAARLTSVDNVPEKLKSEPATKRHTKPITKKALLLTPVKEDLLPTQETAEKFSLAKIDESSHIQASRQDSSGFLINPDVDELALNGIVSKFEVAYEMGDTNLFDSIFSEDIRSNEVENKTAFKRAYKKLFNMTRTRNISIIDMVWNQSSGEIVGEGAFRISLFERSASDRGIYSGDISVTVTKQNDRLMISKLFYHYGED